eukprot:1578625-Ditylum_brightwellii.AAC.1
MIGPLDRWATLNVDMDKKAKARRRIDEKRPPPIQIKIKHEMWRTYIDNNKGNTKISTELGQNLLSWIKGNAINKLWSKHFILQENDLDDINWTSITKAREMKIFYTIKLATKWASERIPTGMEMQDRGAWPTADCPR